MITTLEILKKAKLSAPELLMADSETKNKALSFMADMLVEDTEKILEANKKDMDNAKGHISEVMLDRLMLNEQRIYDMAKGIREVSKLADPVGKVIKSVKRDDGLLIEKVSVPMGVIAIIYESRPNVTSDAAALCIKSGNACILRGGKEAFLSANAINCFSILSTIFARIGLKASSSITTPRAICCSNRAGKLWLFPI